MLNLVRSMVDLNMTHVTHFPKQEPIIILEEQKPR